MLCGIEHFFVWYCPLLCVVLPTNALMFDHVFVYISDIMRVGTGSEVGSHVITGLGGAISHQINYIAVFTGWGGSGHWYFHNKYTKTVGKLVAEAGGYPKAAITLLAS